MKSQEDQKFAQLVQKIDPGSRLLRSWRLQGGISAQVTALEIERSGGQTQKMIVRRHGEADHERNPRIAADEFKLLQFLHSAGVAAPAPYYYDQFGEFFATPCIVIEYIEGESEFAPSDLSDYIVQFAAHLSRIHRVDCSKLDISFLPRQEQIYAERLRQRPATVDDSLDEGRIRDALEAVWPLPQQNQAALLHGDFWPGNILWRDGRLAGIIDWEDAALGDPLADLANSRLELLWAFGSEAMQHFTQQYLTMNPIDVTDLPYWDLCAALRPISKAATWSEWAAGEQTMRERHRWFVAQAFEKIAIL
jgi:aminoglycoside phosphotransferase (APT) family kinase protein